jgi:hypothetical protein
MRQVNPVDAQCTAFDRALPTGLEGLHCVDRLNQQLQMDI